MQAGSSSCILKNMAGDFLARLKASPVLCDGAHGHLLLRQGIFITAAPSHSTGDAFNRAKKSPAIFLRIQEEDRPALSGMAPSREILSTGL